MIFNRGQKVVCIDDTSFSLIKRGNIYTVAYMHFNMGRNWVILEGIGKDAFGCPPGWNPSRFRPLIERKTDISVFTKLLLTKELTE